MTTDKELADAYRLVAEDYAKKFGSRTAITNRADELDPPKPEWTEGMIAWVTASDGDARLCMRRKSAWASCVGSDGLTRIGIYEDEVTKVEPLRVLGDDEIAVARVNAGADSLRLRVRTNMRDNYVSLSACDERVLSAYADALDAEAGDAK